MNARESILAQLAARPMTAPGLAERLNLPRQLVHYHLRKLLHERAVVVKDVVRRNSGVMTKVYSLHPGLKLVAVASPAKVQKTLLWLEDHYAEFVRGVSRHFEDIKQVRLDFILFMYHVMRACSELVGIDQHSLLRDYGGRFAGDVVGRAVRRDGGRLSGAEMFRKALKVFDEIADVSPSMFDGRMVHFRTFLGSSVYDSRLDAFIQSVLARVAVVCLGGRTVVEKFPSAKSSTYSYIIRRTGVKQL
ncbi:MAG: winged helix-turn-helix domain-containing protein [Candidatus Caldarchaeum sp.]